MKAIAATERVAALLTAISNVDARTLGAIDTTLDVYAYAAHCGSKGDAGTIEDRRAAGRRADGYRLLRALVRELRQPVLHGADCQHERRVGDLDEVPACQAVGCGARPLGGPGDGERFCANCVRADQERARREAVG